MWSPAACLCSRRGIEMANGEKTAAATVEIKREFEHRGGKTNAGFGRIGSVTLVAPATGWKLNGKTLPFASVEYLANFALQNLQDKYAGAQSRDEAVSLWTQRVTALIEGTVGVRENAGVPSDDASVRARKLAKDTIKRALVAQTGEKKVEMWVKTPAGGKYFKNSADGFVWNETAVEDFIGRQAAAEKPVDYRAIAAAQIAGEKEAAEIVTL